MAAFAIPEDIKLRGRPLPEWQRTDAQMMLDAAASWIRERKPGIAPDDPNAKLVSIQVVKAALISEAYLGLSAFSKTTGEVTRSGTLANPGQLLVFTDFHKELLGIPFRAGPVWSFKVGDY
ncbi:hypothetical protein IM25_22725 [Rhodococcus sp. p52]|uniref:hypothetical protein n=1 Tax=Rhodococcus sp. p52 TaxID=935199 RepID=UPI00068EA76C|nr:hypothetical protein [Rhodococcus sp. p52]AOD24048.1 hypothetical protein IM25_22725 [Rhodococcus sp. p52]